MSTNERRSSGYGVPADENRPGQRLLPAYAVKMLKYLRIGFGTEKTPGIDLDPTMDLIAHIIECIGVLRDVNKVYRAKGSISSRSVGARCMFGFSAELGNVLLDSITFTADEPAIIETAASCYANIAQCILLPQPLPNPPHHLDHNVARNVEDLGGSNP